MSRWSSGEVVPQRLNKQRLVEPAYVAEAVTEILPPEEANLWMSPPTASWATTPPQRESGRGGYQDVLDLVDAVADGVVV